MPVELALEVVLADEHLLVVDKPAGLVVHPSGPDDRTTLVHGLLGLGAAGGDPERPGIVHRLDRDTSGLLLVARPPRRTSGCPRRSGNSTSSGATSRSSAAGHARGRGGSRLRSAATGATGHDTRSTPTPRARR